MTYRIGDQIFDRDKICGVKRVTDPAEVVTILLDGGHSMTFEGAEAPVVWNLLCSFVELSI